MTDEEFVSQHWDVSGAGLWRTIEHGCVPWRVDDADGWSAARAFTEERLEQIRLIEEEIIYLISDMKPDLDCGIKDCCHCAASRRILAREQEALAELKRGMKEATR
jgi:hypothetical protein